MLSQTLWLGHWVLNRGREPQLELNLLLRQVSVLCRDSAGKQFLYSHNYSFFWMSRHQVLIHKVLGLSWRFYAALRIMDNQFCARKCLNYSIMLDFSFVYSIHQVTFNANFMHRSLLTPVSAFRRTFPGDPSPYFQVSLSC
jgi:hypothetical protein